MTQIRAKGGLDARYIVPIGMIVPDQRSRGTGGGWKWKKAVCFSSSQEQRQFMGGAGCLDFVWGMPSHSADSLHFPAYNILSKNCYSYTTSKGTRTPLCVVLWMLEVLQIVIWMSKSKQQRCNCFMILSFVPSSGNGSMFFF